ncbi:MAG: hypothetical protein OXD44_10930 [Gammaproteobacteria bacterium]|nr:hypothetical protein [Gammaproteobacteria bacterium]
MRKLLVATVELPGSIWHSRHVHPRDQDGNFPGRGPARHAPPGRDLARRRCGPPVRANEPGAPLPDREAALEAALPAGRGAHGGAGIPVFRSAGTRRRGRAPAHCPDPAGAAGRVAVGGSGRPGPVAVYIDNYAKTTLFLQAQIRMLVL